MPPRKFKICDVVRVKGDRKLARVRHASAQRFFIHLDRKVAGFITWRPEDLVLVKAASRKRPVSGQKRRKNGASG